MGALQNIISLFLLSARDRHLSIIRACVCLLGTELLSETNVDGKTMLDLAAANNHFEIVRLLLTISC